MTPHLGTVAVNVHDASEVVLLLCKFSIFEKPNLKRTSAHIVHLSQHHLLAHHAFGDEHEADHGEDHGDRSEGKQLSSKRSPVLLGCLDQLNNMVKIKFMITINVMKFQSSLVIK